MTPESEDPDHAVKMALALLWQLDERLEGLGAAAMEWRRYERDYKRWIAQVTAADRAHELPPDLLRKRAIFNLHEGRS